MLLKNLKRADRKILTLIIGFYSAFSVFALLKMIYFKSIGERFTNSTWSYMFFGVYAVDYLLVILFMSVVFFIIRYMIKKNFKWGLIISIHLILSILLGIFIFVGLVTIHRLLGTTPAQELSFKEVFYYYMNVIDLNFLIYFSIAGLIHTYYYLSKANETELQKVILKDHLLEAKMKMLQSQVKPHFLFNTLNSIYTLMDGDKNKSKEMLTDLSDLLRDIIGHKDAGLIRLSEELVLLKKYLRITKIRFSDDLDIHLKVNENIENPLVPNMIIQPLIENAIKHGFNSHETMLTIKINIYKQAELLIFMISNNGKLLGNPLSKLINDGTGLKNITDRLEVLFQKNYSFNIYNSDECVISKLIIPYKK